MIYIIFWYIPIFFFLQYLKNVIVYYFYFIFLYYIAIYYHSQKLSLLDYSYLFESTNISIKRYWFKQLSLVSKFVCMLTGLRFVRKCIRGLKCRSVEAVHSPAHHACKPQGSALLSREREKHQPLTTALPSPSQIADSPCPSLISVFRAHSLILSVFFYYYHSLCHSLFVFLYRFLTFCHCLTYSHIQWYISLSFLELTCALLCFTLCFLLSLLFCLVFSSLPFMNFTL